jgi:AcrR family transcriptional regulator
MAGVQVRTRGVTMVLAREPEGRTAVAHLVARVRALFASALERAHGAGLVSPEITPDDLVLVLTMVEGALVGVPMDEAPGVAHRVVRLVGPALRTGPDPAA